MADNVWGVSPLALSFIKKLEGYTPKPAWDYKQHSVGFGTRWNPGDPVGTRADHEAALASEAGKVNSWLDQNVKSPMTENQRAAMVSAGFNLGTGEKGLGRLLGDMNSGNWGNVAQRLPSFNRAGGQVNAGLINRRAAEVEMLTGRRQTLSDAMAAGMAGSGTMPSQGQPVPGAVPPEALVAPTGRYSKLADALLASAAGAKPKGWGDLLNATGDLALGYTLGNKEDKAQKTYSSKLSKMLGGATTPETMAQAAIASGDDALMKAGVQSRLAAKPKSEIGRFRPTKQGVVDTTTGQIVPGTEQKGSDQSEHGTTPVAYQDKDGNIVYTQMSKAGGRKDVDLPEGAKWLQNVDQKNVGTEMVGFNKKTGNIETRTPIDIAGKESQEAVGKLAGQAKASIPGVKSTVENAFETIKILRSHPGLDVGTGASSRFDPRSWIPGTEAYDFQAKNKQAMGQAFMAAREGLKGAGQVTDFEGGKGEQAISNLDTAQSREQYLDALNTLEKMLNLSYTDLQAKANMGGVAPQAAPQAGAQTRLKFNPATGEFE